MTSSTNEGIALPPRNTSTVDRAQFSLADGVSLWPRNYERRHCHVDSYLPRVSLCDHHQIPKMAIRGSYVWTALQRKVWPRHLVGRMGRRYIVCDDYAIKGLWIQKMYVSLFMPILASNIENDLTYDSPHLHWENSRSNYPWSFMFRVKLY